MSESFSKVVDVRLLQKVALQLLAKIFLNQRVLDVNQLVAKRHVLRPFRSPGVATNSIYNISIGELDASEGLV